MKCLHGKNCVGVGLPLVVKLRGEISNLREVGMTERARNLTHTTANHKVLQNSENKLLPEDGNDKRETLVHIAIIIHHKTNRSAGENSS